MDKYQRHWKPHPGAPPRPEDDPASLTPGVVQRLRAVTSARRRIWDGEARKWDMRFPLPQNRSKLVRMLEPVKGVKRHLTGLQEDYASRYRKFREEAAAYPKHRLHDHERCDSAFAGSDNDRGLDNLYTAYERAEQLSLLAPCPTGEDLDVPHALLTATLTLQRHFRGLLTRKHVKAALTYEQLMRRSRLHRLAANRTASDKRRSAQKRLGLRVARLQARFRGYRGRRRAAYVRHRVWTAAARKVQIKAAMPFLARKELRQRRISAMFVSMSLRMREIVRIQEWYRAQLARRVAMTELNTRRYALIRMDVISRMSTTWAAHICDTAVWKTMAELQRQKEALQWAKRYATMVQSVIRAWGAKKAVRLLRTQKARREKRRYNAARRIQAMVRGYQQRGEVIRRAVFVVQEAARLRWIQRSSTLPGGGVDVLRSVSNGLIKHPPTMLQYRIDTTLEAVEEADTNDKRVESMDADSTAKWRELAGYNGPVFHENELTDSDIDDPDNFDGSTSPRYW